MLGLKPLSGVEIDAGIDSAPLRKVFTNSRGAFSLTGVPYHAQVTLTAKKYGYTFSTDDTYPLTMGDSNTVVGTFRATALDLNRSITGTITHEGTATPLANVLVSLTYKGDKIFSSRTTTKGTYTFPNLYQGDSATDYQVLPVLANYTFDPDPLHTYVDLTSTTDLDPSVAQNFSATRVATLSVRIAGLPANTPVSFTINSPGGAIGPSSITPDSLGRYIILIPNPTSVATYTVTPSLTLYTFSPLSTGFLIGATTTLISKIFTAVH
jgi:hypothetical protein